MSRRQAQMPASVLFVCSFNAIRSPMACAILQHLAGAGIRTESAGVRQGLSDPFAAAVMDEIGIDLTEHQPQILGNIVGQSFERIISLSPEAHHHAIEMTRLMNTHVQYWPTLDVGPLTASLSRTDKLHEYRRVRDTLHVRIKQEFEITGGPTL